MSTVSVDGSQNHTHCRVCVQRSLSLFRFGVCVCVGGGGGGSQGDSPEFRLCYVKPALISCILNSQPIRLEVFWNIRPYTY